MRNVVWFSCGAPSAVVAYMSKDLDNLHIVYCDTGGEHEDNYRFIADMEAVLNRPVTILKSNEYSDHFDVFRKTGFLNGPNGARCTVELKKRLRFEFQEPDDVQFFGYTLEEQGRANNFVSAYPEVITRFPLIQNKIMKEDCLAILQALNVELPKMYELGFNNNNCIGCVKGGKGYWNHIKKVFPEVFNRMVDLETKLNRHCLKGGYLKDLTPSRHDAIDVENISCDFTCASTIQNILGDQHVKKLTT